MTSNVVGDYSPGASGPAQHGKAPQVRWEPRNLPEPGRAIPGGKE